MKRKLAKVRCAMCHENYRNIIPHDVESEYQQGLYCDSWIQKVVFTGGYGKEHYTLTCSYGSSKDGSVYYFMNGIPELLVDTKESVCDDCIGHMLHECVLMFITDEVYFMMDGNSLFYRLKELGYEP